MTYLPMPFVPAFNTLGVIAPDANLKFYLTETTTPANVYSDPDLSVSLGAVVNADAFGRFVAIYLDPAVVYRVRLETSLGGLIQEADGIGGNNFATDIFFLQAGPGADLRTVQSRLRDFVSVMDFIPPAQEAAIRAGTSTYDCTADIQAAIDSISETLGGSGGIVYFPIGLYNITAPIVQGNWVSLRGAGRGSQVWAKTGFSGTEMVTVVDGTSAMFSISIEDMFFDGKSRVDNIINAYAWQENGGMRRCIMQGFNVNGVLIQRGDGGAAWTKIEDCEIFGTSTTAQYGIRVDQVSAVGSFMLHISGATITGESGNVLPAAIYCRKDSLTVETLHVEYTDYAMLIEGVGSHIIDGVTGGPGVVRLLAVDSGFTGTIAARGLNPNTATSFVVENLVTGENVAVAEGVITEYTYPNYNFEAALTAQIANVTGNGTSYTVLFPQTRDIGGWYNPATGIATAPKSGKYEFSAFLGLNVTAGVTSMNIALVTTGKTFILFRGTTDGIRTSGGLVTIGGSVTANLAFGETARIVITATGLGADTIDIEANESIFTGAYLYR